MAGSEKSIHAKHRQRVFKEIAEGGLAHLPEHRVLEYILFFAIPRGDTNPLAHALIDHFGSLAGVLEASEEQLMQIKGVGPVTARFLHALPAIDRYYMVSKQKKRKAMKTTEERVKYLRPLFHGQSHEKFYMLALEENDKPIKAILLNQGGTTAVDVTSERIIKEAVLTGASKIILAHNHPNQLAIPSTEDIFSTGSVIRALGVVKIRVVDHIIFGGEEYYSFFDQEKLPFFNMETGELRYY